MSEQSSFGSPAVGGLKCAETRCNSPCDFLKQSCGRGSRPSTGAQRKKLTGPGLFRSHQPLPAVCPSSFYNCQCSKIRSSEPLRWKPAHHTCKTNEPRCNTTVASLAAEMVFDVSDWLIVDKSQRSHGFVCALPPLLHCLLSEHCELQTSER